MSKNYTTYQLIEDYLNHKLTEEQVLDVEMRMELDANFRNYVQEHKIANQIIVKAELAQIKSTLNKIHLNKEKKGLINKIILGLIFVLLFIVGVYFFINNSEQKEEIPKRNKPVENFKEEVKNENKEPQNNIELGNKEDIVSIPFNKPIIEDLPIHNLAQDSLVSVPPPTVVIDNSIQIDTNDLKSQPKEEVKLKDKSKDSLIDLSHVENNSPCLDFSIESEIITSVSCENTSEGQIIIQTKQVNYTYSLKNSFISSKSGVFKQLKPAEYELIAIDDKGCESLPVRVVVESVTCDYIIQPDKAISWQIPTESFDNEIITLEIYNAKSGQKVYARVLDEFSESTWNGEDSSGSPMPMGSYMYLLTSSSKSMKGSITIVR